MLLLHWVLSGKTRSLFALMALEGALEVNAAVLADNVSPQ